MPEMNTPSDNSGRPNENRDAPQSASRAVVVSARNGSNGVNAPNESWFRWIGKYVSDRIKSILSHFGSSETGIPHRYEPNYGNEGREPIADQTKFEATGWASLRQQDGTEEGNGSNPDRNASSEPPRSEPRPAPASVRERAEEAIRDSRIWKIAAGVSLAVGVALGVGGGGVASQATSPDSSFNKYAAKTAGFFWSKKTGYDLAQQGKERQGKDLKLAAENKTLQSQNKTLRGQLDVAHAKEKTLGTQLKTTEGKLAQAETKLKQFRPKGKTAAMAIAKSGTPKHEAKIAKASPSRKHAHAKLAKAHKAGKYVYVDFEKLAISQQTVIDNRLKELMKIRHPDWKIALRNEGVPQSVRDSKDYQAYARKQQYQLRYLNQEIRLAKKEATQEKGQETRLAAKQPESRAVAEAKAVQSKSALSEEGKVGEKKLAETTSGNPPSGIPEKSPEEAAVKGGVTAVTSQVGKSGGGAEQSSGSSSAEGAQKSGEAEKPAASAAAAKPAETLGLKPGPLQKAELAAYIEKANERVRLEKIDDAKFLMKEIKVEGRNAYRIYLTYTKDGRHRTSYFTLPADGKTKTGKFSRNFSYVDSVDAIKQWAERKAEGPKAQAPAKKVMKKTEKKAAAKKEKAEKK